MYEVYRAYDEGGELLYVGMSLCALSRLASHSKSPWRDQIAYLSIERFCDQKLADATEAVAIRDENPKYNSVGRDRTDSRLAWADAFLADTGLSDEDAEKEAPTDEHD